MEPFTNFFLHDGILAITEPFTNFFFHTMEFWLSQSLSRTFSYGWAHETRDFGETLFIYVTKSIYIGSTSLKTLPLDLEPPLQGKEYGPPYSKEIVKK
jgi:hypothetical protein